MPKKHEHLNEIMGTASTVSVMTRFQIPLEGSECGEM